MPNFFDQPDSGQEDDQERSPIISKGGRVNLFTRLPFDMNGMEVLTIEISREKSVKEKTLYQGEEE